MQIVKATSMYVNIKTQKVTFEFIRAMKFISAHLAWFSLLD